MKAITITTSLLLTWEASAFSADRMVASRREALGWIGGAAACSFLNQPASAAGEGEATFNVDDYLRTGLVAQPMGVSGQAGKSKPETGVVLREGSEVSRDSRSGDVLAEILVTRAGGGSEPMPVVASFSSPWPLGTF